MKLSETFEQAWNKEYVRCHRTEDSSLAVEMETLTDGQSLESQQEPFLDETVDDNASVEQEHSSVQTGESNRKSFLKRLGDTFQSPKQPSVAFAIG